MSLYVIGSILKGIEYYLPNINGPTIYINCTTPNQLIGLIESKPQFLHLLLEIDYKRANNLQDVLDAIPSNHSEINTIVIENLAGIVANSHFEYEMMNSKLVAIFRMGKIHQVNIVVLDKVMNKFVDKLVDCTTTVERLGED
jgi:short-subunit dehydrogenase